MAKLGKTFRVTAAGNVKKAKRRLSVSEHIRKKKSKRVRVVRRGTTT